MDMGTPGWKSLHELTQLAWAHDDVQEFYRAAAATGHTGKPVRDRLDQLVRAKAMADKTREIEQDPEILGAAARTAGPSLVAGRVHRRPSHLRDQPALPRAPDQRQPFPRGNQEAAP